MATTPLQSSHQDDPMSIIGKNVKFIGGKYNGFIGKITKTCDNYCAVYTEVDPKYFVELVESYEFLLPLQ